MDTSVTSHPKPGAEYLNGVATSMDEAVIIHTPEGIVRSWTRGAELLFGWTGEEMVGHSILKLVSPPDRTQEGAIPSTFPPALWPEAHECVCVHKEGTPVRVRLSIVPLPDLQPESASLVTVARKLSMANDPERALRASEELNRQIIATSPDCIKLLNLEGRLLYISECGQRLLELTDVRHYLNRSWVELWKQAGNEHVERAFSEAKAGGVGRFQGWFPTERGTPKYWDVILTPLRDETGRTVKILAFSRDITEHKRTEEAIRQSEERFRNVFQHSAMGIAITDIQGRFEQCNPAYCELLGHSESELRQTLLPSLIYPADKAVGLKEMERLLKNEGSRVESETRYLRKDRSIVWIHQVVSLLQGSRGEPAHLLLMVTDITERTRANILLASQKHSLEMLVTGSPLGTVLSDLAQVVEEQTDGRAIASILLLDEGGALRNGASPSLPEEYLQAIDGIRPSPSLGTCAAAAATGQVVITEDFETDANWHRVKDLPLGIGLRACWSQPIVARNGRVLGTFGTYFRERRGPTALERRTVEILAQTAALAIERSQAEHELRESRERLEVFAGQLEQLVDQRTSELLASQTQLRKLATELNLAEQRERTRLASELHDHLQQLLVLGKLKLGQGKRQGNSSFSYVDTMRQVDDILTDALTYTRSLVTELSPPALREYGLPAGLRWLCDSMKKYDLHVSVQLPEDENVPISQNEAVLLFQSVRELLMNIRKHAETDQAMIVLTLEANELSLEVRDRGKGFTLLEGVGSSDAASKFGLFSIRERMRALGGQFNIQSATGQGTIATLSLPIAQKLTGDGLKTIVAAPVTVRDQTRVESERKAHTTHTSVLLVDDHVMMRQGLRSVLEGYEDLVVVGEAPDGAEAVALVRELQPRIVIMDINMPNKNGIEATAEIKSQYPNIVVFGLSVNAEGENAEFMKRAGASRIMTKEAAVEQLYDAIQETMREVEEEQSNIRPC